MNTYFGSSFPHSVDNLKHPVAKQLDYLIARDLNLLFLKLEMIKTVEAHNAELWVPLTTSVRSKFDRWRQHFAFSRMLLGSMAPLPEKSRGDVTTDDFKIYCSDL